MDDKTEFDRVRAHSPEHVNIQLDTATHDGLVGLAVRGEKVAARISKLEAEWDIERVLQLNAGLIALAGTAVGVAICKRWFAVPGAVCGFLLQHAVQGWCPPVSVARRLGIRSRKEINREKYAFKASRGDFLSVPSPREEPTAS